MKAEKSNKIEVTEGAMAVIEDIIRKEHLTERSEILEAVSSQLEANFPGDSCEYHLRRMHLATTQDILRAIDIYFIMRKEFPSYTFRRTGKKAKAKEKVS